MERVRGVKTWNSVEGASGGRGGGGLKKRKLGQKKGGNILNMVWGGGSEGKRD